jgi:hypothetical protein
MIAIAIGATVCAGLPFLTPALVSLCAPLGFPSRVGGCAYCGGESVSLVSPTTGKDEEDGPVEVDATAVSLAVQRAAVGKERKVGAALCGAGTPTSARPPCSLVQDPRVVEATAAVVPWWCLLPRRQLVPFEDVTMAVARELHAVKDALGAWLP